MSPFATADDVLARYDESVVAMYTTDGGTQYDSDRLGVALVDASAEIQGYLDQLTPTRRPSADTLRVHAIKVALYLLAGGRPGKEFESARNAYTDTIQFYKDLIAAQAATAGAPSLGMSSSAPHEVFGPRAWIGFGSRG